MSVSPLTVQTNDTYIGRFDMYRSVAQAWPEAYVTKSVHASHSTGNLPLATAAAAALTVWVTKHYSPGANAASGLRDPGVPVQAVHAAVFSKPAQNQYSLAERARSHARAFRRADPATVGGQEAAPVNPNVEPLVRADMVLADQSYQRLHACPAS